MATSEELAAQLAAIDAAIASGVLEVEFRDRRVRYRSMAELMQARSHIAGQIEALAPGGRVTQIYARTSGGF